MSNEDQTVTVVFNGEICNFQELRRYLRQQGHTFRTCSDTEVIVHGFETWGEAVVNHLNGMFAFAVWDSRQRRRLREAVPLQLVADVPLGVFLSGGLALWKPWRIPVSLIRRMLRK